MRPPVARRPELRLEHVARRPGYMPDRLTTPSMPHVHQPHRALMPSGPMCVWTSTRGRRGRDGASSICPCGLWAGLLAVRRQPATDAGQRGRERQHHRWRAVGPTRAVPAPHGVTPCMARPTSWRRTCLRRPCFRRPWLRRPWFRRPERLPARPSWVLQAHDDRQHALVPPCFARLSDRADQRSCRLGSAPRGGLTAMVFFGSRTPLLARGARVVFTIDEYLGAKGRGPEGQAIDRRRPRRACAALTVSARATAGRLRRWACSDALAALAAPRAFSAAVLGRRPARPCSRPCLRAVAATACSAAAFAPLSRGPAAACSAAAFAAAAFATFSAAACSAAAFAAAAFRASRRPLSRPRSASRPSPGVPSPPRSSSCAAAGFSATCPWQPRPCSVPRRRPSPAKARPRAARRGRASAPGWPPVAKPSSRRQRALRLGSPTPTVWSAAG